MHLIVGLGNFGDQYKNNRHNVGFMTVDKIAETYNFPIFKDKFKGLISKGEINNSPTLLLKPLTYMNLSGESILKTASFYKIPPDKITVIHDDIDLPVGKIKIKVGGGNAGHNGLKSIDKLIGKNYKRVRIGVSRSQNDQSVSNYVLSDFTKEDKPLINDAINEINNNIQDIMEQLVEKN